MKIVNDGNGTLDALKRLGIAVDGYSITIGDDQGWVDFPVDHEIVVICHHDGSGRAVGFTRPKPVER